LSGVFREAEWIPFENRVCFWSGGKDSTVVLHLTRKAWGDDIKVVFVDTGITLPETLEYVERMAEEWSLNLTVLKPDLDFWDYVAKNGFPHAKSLWCRRLLKLEPIKRFLYRIHGYRLCILGIRKRESVKRFTAPWYQKPFYRHKRFKFTYNLCPILEWTDSQVDNYLKKNNIPVNPCYKLYGTSGCYYCPYVANKNHYLNLKRLHPELFENIVHAETVARKGKSALYTNRQVFIHKLKPQTALTEYI